MGLALGAQVQCTGLLLALPKGQVSEGSSSGSVPAGKTVNHQPSHSNRDVPNTHLVPVGTGLSLTPCSKQGLCSHSEAQPQVTPSPAPPL